MPSSHVLHDSDLVVSGGGSWGVAEIAAICELSQHIRFRRVGGASIGAWIATGLALGLTPAHMLRVFTKLLTRGQPGNDGPSLEDWKYPGPFKPLGIVLGRGGMMRGSVLREALVKEFGKARMGDVQLPLRVKVGRMSRRKVETVYSDNESHKRLFVVDVCMCAGAVPGLIDNQQLDPHNLTGPEAYRELFCDAGLANNVPRAMWDDPGDELVRPTTVVRFVDDDRLIPAKTVLDKLNAYWNISRDAAESEISRKPLDLMWDVPIAIDGNAVDFSLTVAECARRASVGELAARRWIEERMVTL